MQGFDSPLRLPISLKFRLVSKMARSEGEPKSNIKETLKRTGIVALAIMGVIFIVSESGLVMSAGVGLGSENFGVKVVR